MISKFFNYKYHKLPAKICIDVHQADVLVAFQKPADPAGGDGIKITILTDVVKLAFMEHGLAEGCFLTGVD